MSESSKTLTGQVLNLTEKIASEMRTLRDKIGNPVRTINGTEPDSEGAVEIQATPPAITVSATTLEAGSEATVTKSGTDIEPVFTFGIPKGEKGETGATGPAGTNAYLTETGVTEGSVGPNGNVYITSGTKGSVLIPYFSVDKYGRVLTTGTRTLTVISGSLNCSNCSNCDDHP